RESASVSGMAKCSSSAILPCMLSPSAALDRRRRVNLNMLLPRFLRRENRAWPSWHGFGHPLGGAPCLVPFRGKGDDDSRADEHPPELHAGIAAADQPGPARLGRALARHLLGRDLP